MTPEKNRVDDQNEYLLGTDDAELARLGFQHRVWSEQFFSLCERAGFAPGQTICDLGCGPGYTTVDLATIVGDQGRVIAVDESERFLAHLKAKCETLGIRNIETTQSDLHALTLPEASLDGAHARWVFCYLREPETVVRAVSVALRVGGVLAVQDYYHYQGVALAPENDAFRRVAAEVERSFAMHGGDTDIAGRLPQMMARCGLEVLSITPISRVARPGTALWQWPETFYRDYVPRLVEMGCLTQSEVDAFFEEWSRNSADPNAFFLTPPMLDVIAVKV